MPYLVFVGNPIVIRELCDSWPVLRFRLRGVFLPASVTIVEHRIKLDHRGIHHSGYRGDCHCGALIPMSL
jgi:hypothetical protein